MSHLPPRGFWDGKSRGQKKRIQSHFQEVQFSSNLQHYLGPFRSSVEIKTSRLLPFLFQDGFQTLNFVPLVLLPFTQVSYDLSSQPLGSRSPTSQERFPLPFPPS